mmetsp:Transcript_161432/g.512965  ORF Transcript_161432/g.512965 Transcript_161432/m.512965 type:complete len:374 (+) Transcript_161432:397-1518(+)
MLKEQVLRRGHHVQAVRLLCTHLRRAIGARPAQLQLQGHTVSHEVVHIGCPLDRLAVDPQQLVARLASQARGRPRDDQHAAAAGGRHSLGAPTRRRSDNWCVLPHRVIDQGIFERDLLSATASFVHAARQCSTKLRLHRRSWRSGFLQHSPSLGLLRHVLLGLLLLGLDRCGCRAKASAAAASGAADAGSGSKGRLFAAVVADRGGVGEAEALDAGVARCRAAADVVRHRPLAGQPLALARPICLLARRHPLDFFAWRSCRHRPQGIVRRHSHLAMFVRVTCCHDERGGALEASAGAGLLGGVGLAAVLEGGNGAPLCVAHRDRGLQVGPRNGAGLGRHAHRRAVVGGRAFGRSLAQGEAEALLQRRAHEIYL